jgi:hypothetical protein
VPILRKQGFWEPFLDLSSGVRANNAIVDLPSDVLSIEDEEWPVRDLSSAFGDGVLSPHHNPLTKKALIRSSLYINAAIGSGSTTPITYWSITFDGFRDDHLTF